MILDCDWLEVMDQFFLLVLNCTVSEDSNY